MPRTKGRPRAPARQAALSMLARRMLSESELRQRLQRKGYPEDEVEDALELVRSYGYVNDAAVADSVTREAERAARGPAWVRQTLLRRGVAEDLRERAADELAGCQGTLARRALAHRFGSAESLDDGDRRRAFRWLLSRGFSSECVADVLGDAG
jgi:regulatory protein